MKKFTMLLSVLALAFFASACSESPMAVETDLPLTSVEAPKVKTTTTLPTDGTKQPVEPTNTTSGYALGME